MFALFLLALLALFPQPIFEENIFFVLAFLFISMILSWRKETRNIDYLDVILFIFIVIISLGLLHSQDISISLRRHSLTYLPLIFVYLISKNQQKDSYILMMKTMFFVGLAVSLFMIYEFYSGKNFLMEHVLKNSFFKNLYFYKNRAFGIFYHPTIAGAYLVMCLPIAKLFLSDKDNKVNPIIGSAAFIFISAAIIVTLDKMAWFVMLGIYLWFLRESNSYFYRSLWISFLVILVTLFLKFNVFNLYFKPYFISTAINCRLEAFSVAARMLMKHPFIGVGLDHFRLLYLNYGGDPGLGYTVRIPDNMYLTILVESGVISFASITVFIILLIKRAFKALNNIKHESERNLLNTALASFIAGAMHSFSYDSFYWFSILVMFWIFAGLIARLTQDPARPTTITLPLE